MSKGGRFEKKNQRSGKKIALIIACVIAASVLGMVAFAATYVNGMLNDVNHVEVAAVQETQPVQLAAKVETKTEAPVADAAVATEPVTAAKPVAATAVNTVKLASKGERINMLVVAKPVWEEGKRLTKTMILCTLDTGTKNMTLTPLLENTLVEVPAYKKYAGGQATLDSVYGLGAAYGNGTAGSMELMNQTLYDNFGVKIDQNFEMDLQVLARVIGRLQSIQIDITETEAAYLTKATGKEIKAGVQEMNGTLAQQFVKMWADEEAEGVDTINGQKRVLNGIMQKVRNDYIFALEPIVRDTMPSITTSMNYDEFKGFLVSMVPMVRSLAVDNGDPCPAEFETKMMDVDGNGTEEEVLTFDTEQIAKVMRELTEGEK